MAEGQADGEGRALPLATAGGDGAAVELDEFLHEGESDAAALVGAGAGVLDPVEPFEEPWHLGLGHTDAGVGDGDDRVPAVAVHRDGDRTVEGELEGVAEQVEDDLLPHAPVDVDGVGQGRAVDLEGQTGPVDGGAEDAGQFGGRRGQVDRLVGRPHAARLDTGEVQQCVDELAQPQPVAVDDVQLLPHLRVRLGQPGAQLLHRAHDQGQGGAELVADVGEEGGLRPVELRELVGAPPLGLVVAGASDRRRDVPGGQLDEAAVALVQRPVAVEGGHQEPVGRATLLRQREDQCLDGRLRPAAGGQVGERGAVEGDQRGLAPARLRPPRCGRVVGGQDGRGGGVPGGDAGRARQAGGAVGLGQVGQCEGEVLRVAGELPAGECQHLRFGADRARFRPEVAQRRHPALADDAFGLLADHAQHADHTAVVVAQRAVGERVVALLGVSGAFEEQQQRLVPGRPPRGQHGVDPRTDVVPDLRPHLARRSAQRPRVLAAQRVASVGVVAEERQLLPPGHPHREPRREQDAHGRPQALRPAGRRPQGSRGPVHRREIPADLTVAVEHVGSGHRRCPVLPTSGLPHPTRPFVSSGHPPAGREPRGRGRPHPPAPCPAGSGRPRVPRRASR